MDGDTTLIFASTLTTGFDFLSIPKTMEHQKVSDPKVSDHKSWIVDHGIITSNHDHLVTWDPSSLYPVVTAHCSLDLFSIIPLKPLF